MAGGGMDIETIVILILLAAGLQLRRRASLKK